MVDSYKHATIVIHVTQSVTLCCIFIIWTLINLSTVIMIYRMLKGLPERANQIIAKELQKIAEQEETDLAISGRSNSEELRRQRY